MAETPITVTELAIYPIKSTRQIRVGQADIIQTGFAHDRRWMLISPDGVFITQRQYPHLVLVTAMPVETGLLLSAPGRQNLPVNTPSGNDYRTVTVWKDECLALDAGAEAAAWFSDYMGMSCRLVYMDDRFKRQVDRRYATSADQTGFADGFPFLLISEASLADLNARLENPVPMVRFRPNMVIRGTGPFAEDSWKRIRIGSVEFRVSKACSRCVMTTVDTDLAVKGKEPLATLANYRRGKGGVLFGQNLAHDGLGTIRVGDTVEILE